MKTCVVIPCYNEAPTIATVVRDFARELPDAEIWVFDNNSTDGSADIARAAGARIRNVSRQGKGAVIRQILRTTPADYYVMVDGDDTYPAGAVHALLAPLMRGEADMVVGDRISGGHYRRENKRTGHGFGNHLVTWLINTLFGTHLHDIMSGYRAFNADFARTLPVLTDGFAVETEVTLHAVDKRMSIREVPVEYRDRPPGSSSKLNTVRDGIRVLRSIAWVFKDCKPLWFFLVTSSVFFAAAAVLLALTFSSAIAPLPGLVGAAAAMATGLTLLACGLILDTLVKLHRESFEWFLLHPPAAPHSHEAPSSSSAR